MQKPWKCLKRVVSRMKTRFTYKWDKNVTERRKKIKSSGKRCRDGNELRKKKIENINEGPKAQEVKLSYQFASSKGDHEIDGSKAKKVMWLKTLKKALKKRHLEDYVEEAGSATEKQRKRVRLDPLVLSKNGENKKNRKQHRKKKVRKERCHDDERKDGNELRMKKIEYKEAQDDVAETLNKSKNNFKSGKGDHKTDKSEGKTLKKAKKRHHEDDVEQAGSDPKKQYKRMKPNTLVLSTNTCRGCMKKRKYKSPSVVPEQIGLRTTEGEKDEEAEGDNVHDYLDPSVSDTASSKCSFVDYFLRSRTENLRESRKKKRKKKRKERGKGGDKTAHILTKAVDSSGEIETLPTHIHKGRVKFFHRNQDKETISCTQVAKNKCTYLSQGMLELTGDAKAFPETSNDLEVQNKLNGKWKKNKEKKKRKEEERKKWVKDIMIIDLTCVNDKKEVINSRAEMAENVEARSQTLRKRRRKGRKEKKKIEGKGARNWLWER